VLQLLFVRVSWSSVCVCVSSRSVCWFWCEWRVQSAFQREEEAKGSLSSLSTRRRFRPPAKTHAQNRPRQTPHHQEPRNLAYDTPTQQPPRASKAREQKQKKRLDTCCLAVINQPLGTDARACALPRRT
jgi:hypothetical protein